MSLVCWCVVAFTFKDMTQVAITVGTSHLYTGHSEGLIFDGLQSTWNGIEESGPATTRVKFGIGFVKRQTTTDTLINTLFTCWSIGVLSCEGPLSAQLPQYSELFWGKNSSPFFIWFGHSFKRWRTEVFGVSDSKKNTSCEHVVARKSYKASLNTLCAKSSVERPTNMEIRMAAKYAWSNEELILIHEGSKCKKAQRF